jgi:FdhD protein
MDSTLRSCPVVRIDSGRTESGTDTLVEEQPLEIVIGDAPFAVVMRTPGDETAHALGLLLGEGVIADRRDVGTVEHCNRENGNRIVVTLSPRAAEQSRGIAMRRSFLSQSSCGICGKTILDEISQRIGHCDRPSRIASPILHGYLEQMVSRQRLRKATGGTHAMALFGADGKLLAFAEDVGRHNALDKVVGQALLRGCLPQCDVCVASSRASFEMVQKAAAAGIPILATVSAPTALAVELAERAGMTLVSFLREASLRIYTRADRVAGTAAEPANGGSSS